MRASRVATYTLIDARFGRFPLSSNTRVAATLPLMAKQRQEFLRARVSNMEARIAELTTINLESIPRDTVGLGSRVQLEDLDVGAVVEYEIVVPEEVDGAQNRISLSSPLGHALIGKTEEDDIEVVTPKGKRSYLVKRLITIHVLLAPENGGSRD